MTRNNLPQICSLDMGYIKCLSVWHVDTSAMVG